MNEFLREINKREFQRKFNIEKSIEGTEAFEMNQDIMKGIDQEEILEKARTGYYKDNAYNRKHGLVGKKYKKDPKEDEYQEAVKDLKSQIFRLKNSKDSYKPTIQNEISKLKNELRDLEKKKVDQSQPSSHKTGDTTEHNGKKYKKQANGKWLEVSEQGMTKKEHIEKKS